VFGFSQAEPRGWSDPLTLGALAAGVVLLVAFVLIERRSSHPLLPLRIVLDRNRGGSYLSVLISGAGIFAVFLFLTFYLQNNRGWSPVTTGLAFLPMVAMIVVASTTSNAVLLARVGPRPLVTTGMLLAAAGMLILTQLGEQSSYAGHILPALLVTGLGLGQIFAPAINTATLGVEPADAGVASATVNSCQQVGGSIGTAFLNTMATTATAGYLSGKLPTPNNAALAALHGYTVAFWWAMGIFLVGAAVAALVLRPGAMAPAVEPQLVPA
jgi:predicted MFS family arabinose efflux permease